MPVLESWVEKTVNKELRKWQILYIKNRPTEVGYPDRLYILPTGLHVWIEFKRPGEEPEKIQIYRMRQLCERHAIAGWTDDPGTAIDVCKALLGATQISRAGYFPASRAGKWRALPRPRVGEDFNLLSYLQDLKKDGLRSEDAHYSTLTAHDGYMVRRDREVGGIPGSDVHGAPRAEQEGESEA